MIIWNRLFISLIGKYLTIHKINLNDYNGFDNAKIVFYGQNDNIDNTQYPSWDSLEVISS